MSCKELRKERYAMAFLTVTYKSRALKRKVTFRALIPSNMERDDAEKEGNLLRTLYLLHGYYGDFTSWVNYSRVDELSEKYGMAVIMPSGENSFYLDDTDKREYWEDFIGRELVEFTREIFPLSDKREDTYIAGFSMGGYGALRNGLKYSDVFSKIACFSGALLVLDINLLNSDESLLTKGFVKRVLGDPETIRYSDRDPRYLLECLQKEGKKIPELLLTCGEQDFLIDVNRKFCSFLDENKIPYRFIGGEGGHDWDYWNKSIVTTFEWLNE